MTKGFPKLRAQILTIQFYKYLRQSYIILEKEFQKDSC